MIWKTRNIRSLFKLKDKASHVSSVVYEGKCNFGENSIGETGRNVTIRRDEHSDIGKNSEPAKHLNQFPTHRFNRKILRKVPNRVRQKRFMKLITLCVYALLLTINWSIEFTKFLVNHLYMAGSKLDH